MTSIAPLWRRTRREQTDGRGGRSVCTSAKKHGRHQPPPPPLGSPTQACAGLDPLLTSFSRRVLAAEQRGSAGRALRASIRLCDPKRPQAQRHGSSSGSGTSSAAAASCGERLHEIRGMCSLLRHARRARLAASAAGERQLLRVAAALADARLREAEARRAAGGVACGGETDEQLEARYQAAAALRRLAAKRDDAAAAAASSAAKVVRPRAEAAEALAVRCPQLKQATVGLADVVLPVFWDAYVKPGTDDESEGKEVEAEGEMNEDQEEFASGDAAAAAAAFGCAEGGSSVAPAADVQGGRRRRKRVASDAEAAAVSVGLLRRGRRMFRLWEAAARAGQRARLLRAGFDGFVAHANERELRRMRLTAACRRIVAVSGARRCLTVWRRLAALQRCRRTLRADPVWDTPGPAAWTAYYAALPAQETVRRVFAALYAVYLKLAALRRWQECAVAAAAADAAAAAVPPLLLPAPEADAAVPGPGGETAAALLQRAYLRWRGRWRAAELQRARRAAQRLRCFRALAAHARMGRAAEAAQGRARVRCARDALARWRAAAEGRRRAAGRRSVAVHAARGQLRVYVFALQGWSLALVWWKCWRRLKLHWLWSRLRRRFATLPRDSLFPATAVSAGNHPLDALLFPDAVRPTPWHLYGAAEALRPHLAGLAKPAFVAAVGARAIGRRDTSLKRQWQPPQPQPQPQPQEDTLVRDELQEFRRRAESRAAQYDALVLGIRIHLRNERFTVPSTDYLPRARQLKASGTGRRKKKKEREEETPAATLTPTAAPATAAAVTTDETLMPTPFCPPVATGDTAGSDAADEDKAEESSSGTSSSCGASDGAEEEDESAAAASATLEAARRQAPPVLDADVVRVVGDKAVRTIAAEAVSACGRRPTAARLSVSGADFAVGGGPDDHDSNDGSSRGGTSNSSGGSSDGGTATSALRLQSFALSQSEEGPCASRVVTRSLSGSLRRVESVSVESVEAGAASVCASAAPFEAPHTSAVRLSREQSALDGGASLGVRSVPTGSVRSLSLSLSATASGAGGCSLGDSHGDPAAGEPFRKSGFGESDDDSADDDAPKKPSERPAESVSAEDGVSGGGGVSASVVRSSGGSRDRVSKDRAAAAKAKQRLSVRRAQRSRATRQVLVPSAMSSVCELEGRGRGGGGVVSFASVCVPRVVCR